MGLHDVRVVEKFDGVISVRYPKKACTKLMAWSSLEIAHISGMQEHENWVWLFVDEPLHWTWFYLPIQLAGA